MAANGQEGRNNNMRTGGTRRHWTPEEEESLIVTMKELIAQGWKSDNGFRPGHLNKAEEIFRQHVSGTDVRGSPHIVSKLQTWRKNYYSIDAILSKSETGFNSDGTFKIEADAEQWNNFVRLDSNASKLRGRGWPLYDAWKEIFRKDRANGENAEDILQAINELGRDSPSMGDDFLAGDYHVNLDDILEMGKEDNYVRSEEGAPAVIPKRQGKKRKSANSVDAVCGLLEEITRSTNLRLDTLAGRIGYDHDLGKVRMEVFEKLSDIPNLSIDDKFNVCEVLVDKVPKLELFLGLPADARAKYVERLLRSNK